MAIALATLIPFLIEAGATIPSLIPGKAERENRKSLGALKDLIDSNELGLTDEEKNAIRGAQYGKAQAELERAGQRADAAGAASRATGSGQFLKQASIRGAEGAKIGTAIEQSITMSDLAKKDEQKQEYESRLAAQDAYRQQKTGAVLGLGMGVAKGIQSQALSKSMAAGTTSKSELETAAQEVADALGISVDEVLKMYGA